MYIFESFIIFKNVSSVSGESFSEDNRKDVTTAVDTVLGIKLHSTVYIGDSIYQPTRNRLLIVANDSSHSIAIISHILTTLSTEGYPQYVSDPSALIDSLNKQLSASVLDGSFFSLLMSETAYPTNWLNIYATDVTFINNEIVFPPTAAPTEYKYISKQEPKLGTTMLTLLVCAVFVCVVFVGVLVYKTISYFAAKHKAARDSEIFILNAKSMSENRPDKNFIMVENNFTEVRTDTANPNITYDCDFTDININSTSTEDMK
jgi:hypothetical protein